MHNYKINIAKCSAKKILTGVVLIFSSAFLIGWADAYELETSHFSVSYGALSLALNDQIRAKISTTNTSTVIMDQSTDKASGKSREEIQKLQQTTTESAVLLQPMSRNYAPEFTIYSAFTTLFDDFDQDGFYQTFSVVFDADVYSYHGNDSAVLYALLYLSENGGPWEHYYTSDDFVIHGDNNLDEYEVITTFMAGYRPQHYDILIDLYQVGYSNVVATYSADDSNALYALPLESNDYDQVYVDSVFISHGSSFSVWSLGLSFLLLAARFTGKLR